MLCRYASGNESCVTRDRWKETKTERLGTIHKQEKIKSELTETI